MATTVKNFCWSVSKASRSDLSPYIHTFRVDKICKSTVRHDFQPRCSNITCLGVPLKWLLLVFKSCASYINFMNRAPESWAFQDLLYSISTAD